MTEDPRRAVARAFRDEWGRILATLIHRTGNWDLAEECTQQAFAEAVRRWPVEGVPQRPGGWLTTVARNRAIDQLRHAQMKQHRLQEAIPLMSFVEEDFELPDEGEIEDERLRLIFTCCHPALPLEGRVALTLRSLAGLTTAEIARAFFVTESTMAKRLVRAKGKIARAGIPFRVPTPELRAERTGGVLAVLYLLFNEGYSATAGGDLIRGDLCLEAVRLGRALVELMPDEPEAAGLLALMLFQHSRRRARVSSDGDLVTLGEQDRCAWDREEIDEATQILDAALRQGVAGPYVLQAAIAACHATASSPAATDWTHIAMLYERLLDVMPHALIRLNHAVAIGMAGDPDAALARVEELVSSGQLRDYHLLHATRADLLRRLGRNGEAGAAYRRALTCRASDAERRLLRRRLEEVA